VIKKFVSRLYPYPEINEVGLKYGKKAQDRVKLLYKKKETDARDRAKPNKRVIDLIKQTKLPQTIWSNNLLSTISYLLKKAYISDKIQVVSSLDMVIQSKPNIEGFEIIRKHYPNIDKDKILLIGDSLISDKVSAQKANIGFYHYKKRTKF
jgi:HAD superfamily hydrolase (TIGR01549 family)